MLYSDSAELMRNETFIKEIKTFINMNHKVNERHVETIWPPMFGFRLLPTNSDLIIIKKLFRAANFSGAGGDEKLKIIFNWPYRTTM
jgi:hypothetical protein